MKNVCKKERIIYIVVAACSLLLMVVFGHQNGFWFDEYAQVYYSGPHQSLIDSILIPDPTPPLFTAAANLWMRIVPLDELYLLLLPQIAVAVAVFITGIWCQSFFGLRGGMLAASLMGFSQMILEQCGFEFRGYGFYLCFSVLVLYLHRNYNIKVKSFIIYALALACLAYCHVFGALMCFLLGMWDLALILRGCIPKRSMIPYVIAGAAFLPWIVYFIHQMNVIAASEALSWTTKPTVWDIVKLITFLCGNHIVVCVLFAIGVVQTFLKARAQKKWGEESIPLFLGLSMIFIIFFYGLLRDGTGGLWVKRYFTCLFPCAIFLAVSGAMWMVEYIGKRKNLCVSLIIISVILVGTFRVLRNEAPFGIYYHREAAEVLRNEQITERENAVVLSSLGTYAKGWSQLYLEPYGIEIEIIGFEDKLSKPLSEYDTVYVDTGYGQLPESFAVELHKNFALTENWDDISLSKYKLSVENGELK